MRSAAPCPSCRTRAGAVSSSSPGCRQYDASVLTSSRELADYFEATAGVSGNAKASSNWIMGALSARLNDLGMAITDVPLTPERLGGLIRLIDAGTISGPVTRDVFEKMFTSESGAAEIVEREGLARIDDQDAIVAAVREVLAANPQPVEQYRAGKQQTFGFLVGKVMKATRGKANPALVNDVLRRLLSEDGS